MDKVEAGEIMSMAIGRLFLLGSRPEQPGDIETFYKIRSAVMEAAEVLELELDDPRYELNYTRDRLKGAQGDS